MNYQPVHKPKGCTAHESEETPLDGQVCEITPEMIEACRVVLDEWGAFEWGRPLPGDSLISWSLEAALQAAGFSPKNPLGPELDD